MLTARAIAEASPGPLGRDLTVVTETGSTNDDLLAEARRGAPAGRVLVAEGQTAGRGRLGRRWISPAGQNLYLSLLLRPSELAELPPLALVAGLALSEALDEVAPEVTSMVKWPNDVLIGGRKVAGILTEAQAGPPHALVIGIGLNVNVTELPEEIATIATSLRLATGRRHSRATVAAAVLRRLERRLKAVLQGGLDRALADWSDRSSTLGALVRTAEGWQGEALGIDRSGALILQTRDGALRAVVAGPIEVLD